MDISFKTQEGRFNYRVAGVLVNDDKILIMRDENSPYYYIPGGRVSLGESSESAIKREIKEELGISVIVDRLLWVVESFFEEDRTKEHFHEIAVYYMLRLPDNSILNKGDEFCTTEGGKHTLTFTWKKISEVHSLYFYPLSLKDKLLDLPNKLEHVVERK